jgi:CheY-like chemotaxis protein
MNGPLRIFLIEEEGDTARLALFRLKKMGYDVEDAENGLQAVEKLLRSKPDIIFLSENIPVFDAGRLCEKIRSDERLKGVPLVLLTTGTGDPGAKVLKFRANDYLPKPYVAEELKEKIKIYCQ